MRVTTEQLEATLALGRVVGTVCHVGDVVALDGELGAGKTQFVRGLAEGLGLDPRQVSSPTFVFMQEYLPSLPDNGAVSPCGPTLPVLVHADAYRLHGADEFDTLGWDDDLLDGAVLAVEWAGRIVERLSPDRLHVKLEHAGGTSRHITLEPHGAWLPRMPELEERWSRCVSE